MSKQPILVDAQRGIKVGGYRYAVRTGKTINTRLKEGDYWGRCYHKECEILVDNSGSELLMSSHIIHETVHAIDQCFKTKLSESQVSRLANGIHQVLEELGIRFTIKGRKKEA